jgi:hypothetical protein
MITHFAVIEAENELLRQERKRSTDELRAATDENDSLLRLLACYDELTSYVENMLATVDKYGVRLSDINELERLAKKAREWK